jgi:hypothetical protein
VSATDFVLGVQLLAGFRIEEHGNARWVVKCTDCARYIDGHLSQDMRDIWLYEHAAICPRPRV